MATKTNTRVKSSAMIKSRSNNSSKFKIRLLVLILVFAAVGAYIVYKSFAAYGLSGADGEFTPVTQARILDTRNGNGGYTTSFSKNTSRSVQVTGRGGIPATNVKAVVINVTALQPTSSTYITVWPSDKSRPNYSSMNIPVGQTLANHVTTTVSKDGKISLYNSTGSTNVLVDVAGYYTTSEGKPGARFKPVSPARILDTRNGNGGYNTSVGQGVTRSVQVTGRGGISDTIIRAVVLNVTGVTPTANTSISVWPSGAGRPASSNISLSAGITRTNMVTVMVGTDGKLNFYNNAGNTHVIFDVVGYYKDPLPGYEQTQEGRFVAEDTPLRYMDTRRNGNYDIFTPGSTRIEPGITMNNGEESGATTVLNVTAVAPTAKTHLTLWPVGQTAPITSNIQLEKGETIANQVILSTNKDGEYKAGEVNIRNNAGNVHVIIDEIGHFSKGEYDSPNVSTSYSSTTYGNKSSSKIDIKFSSIPSKSNISRIFIQQPVGGSSLESTRFDVAKSGSTLTKSCLAAQKCEMLTGGSVSPVKYTDWSHYKTPYAFTTGVNYTYITEVVTDQVGYPGKWFKSSIKNNTTGLVTPIFMEYSVGQRDIYNFFAIYAYPITPYSCDSKETLAFSTSNALFDDQPSYVNEGGYLEANGTNCKGFSSVSEVNGIKTLTVGIPPTQRDITPPVIKSLTFVNEGMTISASDNKLVSRVVISKDPDSLSGFGRSFTAASTIDNKLVYISSADNLLEPDGKPTTLYVTIFDNSGNYSTKSVSNIVK